MISSDGKTLLIAPYDKHDLKSHYIPPEVYHGDAGCDIHSYKLCRVLAWKFHWNLNHSYRIQGWIDKRRQVATFDLASAEMIDNNGAK